MSLLVSIVKLNAYSYLKHSQLVSDSLASLTALDACLILRSELKYIDHLNLEEDEKCTWESDALSIGISTRCIV